MSARPVALKARYVFPVAGPPIPDGVISLAGERIMAVGENRFDSPPLDLGNVAILPGLVNAHTHLEFSDLAAPLGTAANPLPAWIAKVVSHRQASAAAGSDARASGLSEIVAGGATTIGEIATSPWPVTALGNAAPPADITLLWEVIGLDPNRFAEHLAAAKAHLERDWRAQKVVTAGLSPHAPYSVHPSLLLKVVGLANEAGAPVAMHVAESREEIELLAHGTGPLRELLETLGVWREEIFPGGRRALDELKALARAPRALVIHGNYLDREEIEFLATKRAHMSVVFCPRTHHYFGHEPYRLAEMLERGVHLALGTDSRASNPDLNLLSELRFAARTHSSVAPDKLLAMATLAGARALGLDREQGTLEARKFANLTVVALPDRSTGDPHELLLDSELPVVATWRRGTIVHPTPAGSVTAGNS
jgi:aminodeoxyfutalosine deaminase